MKNYTPTPEQRLLTLPTARTHQHATNCAFHPSHVKRSMLAYKVVVDSDGVPLTPLKMDAKENDRGTQAKISNGILPFTLQNALGMLIHVSNTQSPEVFIELLSNIYKQSDAYRLMLLDPSVIQASPNFTLSSPPKPSDFDPSYPKTEPVMRGELKDLHSKYANMVPPIGMSEEDLPKTKAASTELKKYHSLLNEFNHQTYLYELGQQIEDADGALKDTDTMLREQELFSNLPVIYDLQLDKDGGRWRYVSVGGGLEFCFIELIRHLNDTRNCYGGEVLTEDNYDSLGTYVRLHSTATQVLTPELFFSNPTAFRELNPESGTSVDLTYQSSVPRNKLKSLKSLAQYSADPKAQPYLPRNLSHIEVSFNTVNRKFKNLSDYRTLAIDGIFSGNAVRRSVFSKFIELYEQSDLHQNNYNLPTEQSVWESVEMFRKHHELAMKDELHTSSKAYADRMRAFGRGKGYDVSGIPRQLLIDESSNLTKKRAFDFMGYSRGISDGKPYARATVKRLLAGSQVWTNKSAVLAVHLCLWMKVEPITMVNFFMRRLVQSGLKHQSPAKLHRAASAKMVRELNAAEDRYSAVVANIDSSLHDVDAAVDSFDLTFDFGESDDLGKCKKLDEYNLQRARFSSTKYWEWEDSVYEQILAETDPEGYDKFPEMPIPLIPNETCHRLLDDVFLSDPDSRWVRAHHNDKYSSFPSSSDTEANKYRLPTLQLCSEFWQFNGDDFLGSVPVSKKLNAYSLIMHYWDDIKAATTHEERMAYLNDPYSKASVRGYRNACKHAESDSRAGLLGIFKSVPKNVQQYIRACSVIDRARHYTRRHGRTIKRYELRRKYNQMITESGCFMSQQEALEQILKDAPQVLKPEFLEDERMTPEKALDILSELPSNVPQKDRLWVSDDLRQGVIGAPKLEEGFDPSQYQNQDDTYYEYKPNKSIFKDTDFDENCERRTLRDAHGELVQSNRLADRICNFPEKALIAQSEVIQLKDRVNEFLEGQKATAFQKKEAHKAHQYKRQQAKLQYDITLSRIRNMAQVHSDSLVTERTKPGVFKCTKGFMQEFCRLAQSMGADWKFGTWEYFYFDKLSKDDGALELYNKGKPEQLKLTEDGLPSFFHHTGSKSPRGVVSMVDRLSWEQLSSGIVQWKDLPWTEDELMYYDKVCPDRDQCEYKVYIPKFDDLRETPTDAEPEQLTEDVESMDMGEDRANEEGVWPLPPME